MARISEMTTDDLTFSDIALVYCPKCLALEAQPCRDINGMVSGTIHEERQAFALEFAIVRSMSPATRETYVAQMFGSPEQRALDVSLTREADRSLKPNSWKDRYRR